MAVELILAPEVEDDLASYPVVHETYHRALVRRFPYAVFFGFSEERVTVHAVFHTADDPDKWRQRLP